jgi:hypothetical protein
VYALATTTCSILRGSTTDGYGDELDADTPVRTNVPISIMEISSTVMTPEDPTPRVVRQVTARVGSEVDVRDGDRVKDESTGTIYMIDNVIRRASPVYTPDTRLDLRLVN